MEIYSKHSLSIAERVLEQGRPNPNPMSANYIVSLQKIAVHDSFTLGLAQIGSKKLAKVRTTFQKKKYFGKVVHFVLSNSAQSPIT